MLKITSKAILVS